MYCLRSDMATVTDALADRLLVDRRDVIELVE
jgi:hypothetical protein